MQDRLPPGIVIHIAFGYHASMLTKPVSSSSIGAKRSTLVTVDLLEYKARWLAYCKSLGLSPSAAFRNIAAQLTSKAPMRNPVVCYGEGEKPTKRHEVAFTPSEYSRFLELAKAEGFSPGKWLVALVRWRVASTPQFGQHEIEALARSNKQLLAIGRNLNQIARSLNADPTERVQFRIDLIEELDSTIKKHTRLVSNLVTANIERWRIE